MSKLGKQVIPALASFLLAAVTATIVAETAKPKRINQAIELLAEGQPIYYTGSHSGTTGTYEQGVKDAQTYADYISYDMEHAPFDVKGLQEYMRGLVAGGPDQKRSSHPGRYCQRARKRYGCGGSPRQRLDVQPGACYRRARRYAHPRDDPGAIRAFVEAVRFPIHHQGVGVDGLPEGRRGVHGVANAAQIWGVSQEEYEEKADVWPLNPNGELLLGVKEEDKYALANVEENLKVPGIGMAEWGPATWQCP